MIVILAIDALEYELVERFNCAHLKQEHYGKTDISEFTEPRTMVLWTSFLTGRNTEKEILAKGKKAMWDTRIPIEDAFLKSFSAPKVIDLPGYSYDKEQHESERNLLKEYFNVEDDRREEIRDKYNEIAFEHHRIIKKQFKEDIAAGHDILIGYFSLADVIGHLNYGNATMMKLIYKDFDEIAANIREEYKCKLLVLSDHGMKAVGQYGDHSEYGFWSTNTEDIGSPRITDFAGILPDWHLGGTGT
jgi:hypothetical protein